MSSPRRRRVVILGGAGYCGSHFAVHLVERDLADEVLLVDLVAPSPARTTPKLAAFLASGRVSAVIGDVRRPLTIPDGPVDLLVNFAAVHREPGHADAEYWATNVPGAENACALATLSGCTRQLYISSIAIYGERDEQLDEDSEPRPTTAYGASKLAAEQIHRAWVVEDPARRLLIVRPGVVFGPGELGNVSRLIRALVRRRFAYVGPRSARKAGIYVGEFASAALWVLDRLTGRETLAAAEPNVVIANLTMHPAPTVEDYVRAIGAVVGRRLRIPTIPLALALPAALVAQAVAVLVGRSSDWHPERLRKLTRSNDIVPKTLLASGYAFHYSLTSALQEWKALRPDEWE